MLRAAAQLDGSPVSGPARWMTSGSLARPPTGARSQPVVNCRKARLDSRLRLCTVAHIHCTAGVSLQGRGSGGAEQTVATPPAGAWRRQARRCQPADRDQLPTRPRALGVAALVAGHPLQRGKVQVREPADEQLQLGGREEAQRGAGAGAAEAGTEGAKLGRNGGVQHPLAVQAHVLLREWGERRVREGDCVALRCACVQSGQSRVEDRRWRAGAWRGPPQLSPAPPPPQKKTAAHLPVGGGDGDVGAPGLELRGAHLSPVVPLGGEAGGRWMQEWARKGRGRGGDGAVSRRRCDRPPARNRLPQQQQPSPTPTLTCGRTRPPRRPQSPAAAAGRAPAAGTPPSGPAQRW